MVKEELKRDDGINKHRGLPFCVRKQKLIAPERLPPLDLFAH